MVERLRLVSPRGTGARPPGVKSPTVLSEKIIAAFCKFIRKGLPADGACDLLSISTTSYWEWMRRGDKFITGEGQPPEDEIFGLFVAEFRRAHAEYRLERIDRLHKAKNKEWIRELAILERRDRKSFSRYEPAGGSIESYNPDEKFL